MLDAISDITILAGSTGGSSGLSLEAIMPGGNLLMFAVTVVWAFHELRAFVREAGHEFKRVYVFCCTLLMKLRN